MNLNTKIAESDKLLQRIKANLPALEELCARTDDEDLMYRFYHESYKVYRTQGYTERIVTTLQELAPHLPLNPWFLEIVAAGTGQEFPNDPPWTASVRPILEAYHHARYFLQMTCKYGRKLESPPDIMPSGLASVLYLFNLR